MFSYQLNPQEVNNKFDLLNKPGIIKGYNGSTAPSGYLFCDGSAVSRTTYAALFAAIGTTYGSGNGTTTFNLPTWQSVVSAVTIPTSIAVYGNGKSIGFAVGSTTAGLVYSGGLSTRTAAYNVAPATSGAGSGSHGYSDGYIVGLSTATGGQSGIIAKSNSITRTAFNSKFIIKY